MMARVYILIFVGALCSREIMAANSLEEVFAWKELEFVWPTDAAREQAIASGAYIPAHNLPLGIDRWNDKLFVTVPRWKNGVASSLNVVYLNNATKTSPLLPYPSLEANTLPVGDAKPTDDTIISTFRVRVDACDRLWVMDTGLADILGEPKVYSQSALLIYDLKTDKLIRRYTFKETDLKEDSFFANVVVDVTADKCDDAFAYIPDLGGYGIVVYSFAANDSWRVKHNFFHFDPLAGDYNVGGVNFQWTDGVFGLALSPVEPDGYRTMYFHALSSTKEFTVSTSILKNATAALDPHNYYEFKLLGDRGEKTQSSANFLDENSGVLFYTQVNKDAIACWNSKKPFTQENIGIAAQDKETLIFPNDLKVDPEGNLWVLSDRMPAFIYRSLDSSQVNYRILKSSVQDAIANTPCAG